MVKLRRRQMSKGSKQRPSSVSREQFEDNWAKIFSDTVNKNIVDTCNKVMKEAKEDAKQS